MVCPSRTHFLRRHSALWVGSRCGYVHVCWSRPTALPVHSGCTCHTFCKTWIWLVPISTWGLPLNLHCRSVRWHLNRQLRWCLKLQKLSWIFTQAWSFRWLKGFWSNLSKGRTLCTVLQFLVPWSRHWCSWWCRGCTPSCSWTWWRVCSSFQRSWSAGWLWWWAGCGCTSTWVLWHSLRFHRFQICLRKWASRFGTWTR